VQAMVDKITAQRDVEYFYELLAKETDENKRVILQRLLADAEKLRQSDDQEENSNKKTNADQVNVKGD
jgi:hypothetical protein